MRWMRRMAVERLGVAVNRVGNLYPWQVDPVLAPSHTAAPLPPGAREHLRRDHPLLADLTARYAAFDPAVTTPAVWSADILSAHDLLYFRGDNPYVFQLRMRSGNELAYALTYYHLMAGDARALLARCGEDELFGVHGWIVDGRLVSRDLLDSVAEIAFLQRHVVLGAETAVLDIGAGYGRLAHRLAEATEATVLATDAVPASTFLCDYYLRFRGSRARAVPLDRIEATLAEGAVDVATNIHSFSECRPAAIDWWVSRLAANGVRHAVVVPNRRAPDGRALTNEGEDMDAIFARHGYRLAALEPRYADPIVERWGVNGGLISLFALG